MTRPGYDNKLPSYLCSTGGAIVSFMNDDKTTRIDDGMITGEEFPVEYLKEARDFVQSLMFKYQDIAYDASISESQKQLSEKQAQYLGAAVFSIDMAIRNEIEDEEA